MANAIVSLYDMSVCQSWPASLAPMGRPFGSVMFDRIMISGWPGSWNAPATLISSEPNSAENAICRELSDGAALLALADAWDVMVAGRTYSPTKSVEEAYEECRSLAGLQFTQDAVTALEHLYAGGALKPDGYVTADIEVGVAARSVISR